MNRIRRTKIKWCLLTVGHHFIAFQDPRFSVGDQGFFPSHDHRDQFVRCQFQVRDCAVAPRVVAVDKDLIEQFIAARIVGGRTQDDAVASQDQGIAFGDDRLMVALDHEGKGTGREIDFLDQLIFPVVSFGYVHADQRDRGFLLVIVECLAHICFLVDHIQFFGDSRKQRALYGDREQ